MSQTDGNKQKIILVFTGGCNQTNRCCDQNSDVTSVANDIFRYNENNSWSRQIWENPLIAMQRLTFVLHRVVTISTQRSTAFPGSGIRTDLLPVFSPSPSTGNPRTGGPRPPFVHINPKFPTRNSTLIINFPVKLSLLVILPLLWQQIAVVSEPCRELDDSQEYPESTKPESQIIHIFHY